MKNTSLKNDNQFRKYQLTINNPLDAEIEINGEKVKVPFTHEEIKKRLANMKSIQYWCMADEIGNEGKTPHTHIFLYSRSPLRFSTVKRQFPTAHIESAYGSCQSNKDYITKTGKWAATDKKDTSVEGSFDQLGTMPAHEAKGIAASAQYLFELMENGYSDAEILRMYPESMLHLDKVQRARATLQEDDCKSKWRDLTVTYIYGKTNTGKTRSVMEKHGYANVYRITDYAHPWDGYKMQDIVLFEEFRSSLRIQDMLSYLDGYPCTLPARYANKQAGFTKVYITTNIPLEKQYPEIQENESETWEAFLRRISRIQRYETSGVIITFESVSDYFSKHPKKPPIATLPKVSESISDEAFAAFMPPKEEGEHGD